MMRDQRKSKVTDKVRMLRRKPALELRLKVHVDHTCNRLREKPRLTSFFQGSEKQVPVRFGFGVMLGAGEEASDKAPSQEIARVRCLLILDQGILGILGNALPVLEKLAHADHGIGEA